jgi:DNA-binding NarL/FixJ family response regulator
MDLRQPDVGGIDAMIAIRSEFPDASIILLTTFGATSQSNALLTIGKPGSRKLNRKIYFLRCRFRA